MVVGQSIAAQTQHGHFIAMLAVTFMPSGRFGLYIIAQHNTEY